MTTRTGDEAALLAAIRAFPEEDTPRLALADALDERGDAAGAARAEFIRLQIETDGVPLHRNTEMTYREWEQKTRRWEGLLAAHEAEWRAVGVCWECIDGTAPAKAACGRCGGTQDVGGLMGRVNREREVDQTAGGTHTFRYTDWKHRVDFRRGFPGVVHCTLGDFQAADFALPRRWLSHFPIREIRFTDAWGQLAEQLPPWVRVRVTGGTGIWPTHEGTARDMISRTAVEFIREMLRIRANEASTKASKKTGGTGASTPARPDPNASPV